MQLCNGIGTVGTTVPPCINANGTMNHTSAVAFVDGLKAINYLGHGNWELPPVPVDAVTGQPVCDGRFGCSDPSDPMGSLFYNTDSLGLGRGSSVALSDVPVDAFSHVQPYLYWSCPTSTNQVPAILSPCSTAPQCDSIANGGGCVAFLSRSEGKGVEGGSGVVGLGK